MCHVLKFYEGCTNVIKRHGNTNEPIIYRRSGNFCVRKLSYDKFLCRKFFVGTTPYYVNINSAHVYFIRLIL